MILRKHRAIFVMLLALSSTHTQRADMDGPKGAFIGILGFALAAVPATIYIKTLPQTLENKKLELEVALHKAVTEAHEKNHTESLAQFAHLKNKHKNLYTTQPKQSSIPFSYMNNQGHHVTPYLECLKQDRNELTKIISSGHLTQSEQTEVQDLYDKLCLEHAKVAEKHASTLKQEHQETTRATYEQQKHEAELARIHAATRVNEQQSNFIATAAGLIEKQYNALHAEIKSSRESTRTNFGTLQTNIATQLATINKRLTKIEQQTQAHVLAPAEPATRTRAEGEEEQIEGEPNHGYTS